MSQDSQAVAVSYLRVSTKEQAERDGDPEGYSIPAQREANRRKAAELGAVVVAEFIDRGESARSADRPELQRMLTYIRSHPETSYVVVHKIDRLARNRVDDVTINLALQQAGVQLVSATERIDETPSGMLLHGIMSTIAEFYSRNLANEVVKGMAQKAKTGGTPGKAPLGYRNVGRFNEDGREVRTVELDPVRAPLVAWAFTAYADGSWTVRRLLAELTARGLTTPANVRRPARPPSLSNIQAMLTNPYYKGVVVWRGAQYPGRHTPLVDEVTWQRVQVLLSAHAQGEKEREHHHYLKSTVYCGDCGSRLIVSYSKNRSGAIYPYFMCVGRHQKRTTCQRRAMLIPLVEQLVEEYYAQVQLPAALRTAIEATLRQELADASREVAAERQALQLQQERLAGERTKLLQAHYAGAIPLDLLKVEQDRIAEQLAAVESRLATVNGDLATVERNLSAALDLLVDCQCAYLSAGPKVRRLFNQALFEKLYIDEDGVHAELAEPFQSLLGPAVAALRHDPGVGELAGQVIKSRAQAVGRTHRPAVRQGAVYDAEPSAVGLKVTYVVPPAGFEPATHGLGNRCSIP
ncbi:recombinase family protein [Kineococcus glutinatus]|uniref:Recombinase family protein n=1 Tax=Kineococcus glutinatus TaxID=1070872 RepID=A0ABP9HEQ2_9ACTN